MAHVEVCYGALRIEEVARDADKVTYRLTMPAPRFVLDGFIPLLTFPC